MRPCDNPFRAQCIGRLAFRPQGGDWPGLERRLAELGHRAAIVGPEGSGKTTLMRELGRRLEDRGRRVRWVQITRDRRRFSLRQERELTQRLGSEDVILFDGAGHLALPRWWRFRLRARRAGGLIITAHSGQRLPLLLRTRTDETLLVGLVRELLERNGAAARVNAPLEREVAELHRRHGGNVRDALRELYDRCVMLPAAGLNPPATGSEKEPPATVSTAVGSP